MKIKGLKIYTTTKNPDYVINRKISGNNINKHKS